MMMNAAVVESPGKLSLWNIKIPEVDDYSALVRMEVLAICNSTDSKIKNGSLPGNIVYPTTLGHEGIGTVVKIGKKVRAYKVGDRVINPQIIQSQIEGLSSTWGTMAEYSLVFDHNVMKSDEVNDEEHGYDGVFETQKVIPAHIPSRQAILLATWREVYSSFKDFGFQQGKSLLVFGGGPVGLSFVTFAKLFGMKPVCLTTRSQWKMDKAKSLGADEVFPANENLLFELNKCYPEGFNFIVDAVGSNDVINKAIQAMNFNGTIGVYGTLSEQELHFGITNSPSNWQLIVHQFPDYVKEAAAHEPLCEYIEQEKISSEDYITHEYPFEMIEKGFETVEKNQALKVLLHLQ
jgi:threonine dehydrogenase-like Zn-dependent dehydrogenase